MAKTQYRMRISRLTVDKLGVKLYDKVSAVIAELVANSYDADATKVTVRAPMGEYLATSRKKVLKDKGFTIEVADNGIGMTPEEINDFYLVVGSERRADKRRGDLSKKFKRKVMGRKGVGKLAPFGICQTIEVVSSGGDKVSGPDSKGKQTKGYVTAHLTLNRADILQDERTEYSPKTGPLDGTIAKRTGTTVRLRNFSYRQVPTMEEFGRQLAQRFGVQSADWSIELLDTTKTEGAKGSSSTVGVFDLVLMDNTRIKIDGKVYGPDGGQIKELMAGFSVNGRRYAIKGWVAYARDPYKDDLMAGVRIYCRGKIAAQTNVFGQKAGFTGEHNVRSYLVGELHCDWLDEKEDLIQTDRRDILWSHELGQAFEKWGQSIVKKIGTLSRDPMKKKTWDRFRDITKFEERVEREFPLQEQANIRMQAVAVGKLFGQAAREDELTDPEQAEGIVQLSLMLAPVITLDKKLREAADAADTPLAAVNDVLRLARISELASFGKIAEDRVRVIEKIQTLKDDRRNPESAFQKVIAEAPWLIDPQWSPITSNQALSTLRVEFAKFYEQRTGEKINLSDFGDRTKRPDFVMSSQDAAVQIIEIKRPGYRIKDADLVRIVRYSTLMDEFLKKGGNELFRKLFTDYHITLVCDGEALSDVNKAAFEGLRSKGILEQITWSTFMLKTKNMHQAFLDEAERRRKNAIKKRA